MKVKTDSGSHLLRFERGEDVVAGLTDYVYEQGIYGGWVHGIGGLEQAELGFYNLEAQRYNWSIFEEALELTSLEGTVAWEGDRPLLHMHATIAKQDLTAYGGHARRLITGGTVEVIIQPLGTHKITRTTDQSSGLKLLDL